MIPHDALVNKLRSLNFTFKRQADRVEIYRKRGDTTIVSIRRHDLHDEDAVRCHLKMAGADHGDVESFIASCRTGKH